MTQEELHIWQTLTKSSDRAVQNEAYGVLGAWQESMAREGYYDGTWKEKNKYGLNGLSHSKGETNG